MTLDRRVVVTITLAIAVASCSSTPASTASPRALLPTRTAAPTLQSTPSQARVAPSFLLPGEAAALADLPPGVPFQGHLLIAENSTANRIVEVDPAGNVNWTFATTAPQLLHVLGPPDDILYGQRRRDPDEF